MAMFLPMAAEAGVDALAAGGAEAAAGGAEGAAATNGSSRMLSLLQFGKKAAGPVSNFVSGFGSGRGGGASQGGGADTPADGWARS